MTQGRKARTDVIYELINFSDRYWLKGEPADAWAAALLLGSGMYGLDALLPGGGKDPAESMGLGAFDAFRERFGAPADQYISEHRESVAAALESVTVGHPGEGLVFAEAVAAVAQEGRRRELREKWHDALRTSMNDIGRTAWALAERLRAGGRVEAAAPPGVFVG